MILFVLRVCIALQASVVTVVVVVAIQHSRVIAIAGRRGDQEC